MICCVPLGRLNHWLQECGRVGPVVRCSPATVPSPQPSRRVNAGQTSKICKRHISTQTFRMRPQRFYWLTTSKSNLSRALLLIRSSAAKIQTPPRSFTAHTMAFHASQNAYDRQISGHSRSESIELTSSASLSDQEQSSSSLGSPVALANAPVNLMGATSHGTLIFGAAAAGDAARLLASNPTGDAADSPPCRAHTPTHNQGSDQFSFATSSSGDDDDDNATQVRLCFRRGVWQLLSATSCCLHARFDQCIPSWSFRPTTKHRKMTALAPAPLLLPTRRPRRRDGVRLKCLRGACAVHSIVFRTGREGGKY